MRNIFNAKRINPSSRYNNRKYIQGPEIQTQNMTERKREIDHSKIILEDLSIFTFNNGQKTKQKIKRKQKTEKII